MKVLLSCLKEYIDIQETPEKIAELLTNAGIEVDGIEPVIPQFTGVIAAKVIKTEKHPQSEKLTIAQVFDGKNEITLVCGAPNCRPGITVALAPIGATLRPDGPLKPALHVSKATIRGQESHGMLCSEKELLLSDFHDEIIELDDIAPGTSLEALSLFQDVIFEVSLTPNLGHAMSILGIARELSAITGRPLKTKATDQVSFQLKKGSFTILLETKDCPRYSALLIKGIEVKKSPLWLRLKLERCGIRSVNDIVDLTNLIALEFGQPLHAFDADRIEDKQIIVRSAKAQEQALLLGGKEISLPVDAVVIADPKKVCAVGGVMGGELASVTEDTKAILLESAYFLPTSIRKTRKALGILSDAAKRYERGCDPRITLQALGYAAALLKKICPKAEIEGVYDSLQEDFKSKQLTCRRSRTSQILGYEVSIGDMEQCFVRDGFEAKWDGSDLFTVLVPPYRHDIKEEIDLIEEVSRLFGVKSELVKQMSYKGSEMNNSQLFLHERQIRERLLTENLQEFVTCDLISPKMVEIVRNHPIDQNSLVKVMNPVSEEQSILRPSTLPGLLDVVHRNICQRILDISGFEIGHVHFKNGDKYQGRSVFGIVLSGKASLAHFDTPAKEVDFFDLKGIVENILRSFAIPEALYKKSALSIFHPGRQAKIIVEGLQVGTMGELHPQVLRQFDISQRVLFAEFDIQDLFSLQTKERKFVSLAEFPSSERDWTVTVAEEISYEEMKEAIELLKSPILESISLVAIFRHEKLGPDKKNMTLRFVFRDRFKTVSQEEVDKEHARITTETVAKLTHKQPV